MKTFFLIVPLLAVLTPAAGGIWDPISQAPDIIPGWSPAQASDFQGAKIQYAQATQHFGFDSPQAAAAHERLLVMAKALGADKINRDPSAKPVEPVAAVDFRSLTVFSDQRDITQK